MTPTQRVQLHYALSDCISTNFEIQDIFGMAYRLPASTPVKSIQLGFNESVLLSLNCAKDLDNNIYSWNLYCKGTLCEKRVGLTFILVNDKVTKALMSFSAITFYISIVIVIGRIIRGGFEGMETEIISTELPHPNEIINLCEAIVIARNEGDFEL